MKIVILLMSCNKERFIQEAKAMKNALNNQIKKYDLTNYINVYDYAGDSEEIYLNDSTIYINSKDNIENTYDKTIKCFQYIKDNIEYDYIFKTNTSTFINVKLLYEFIKYIDKHNKNLLKLYSSALINTVNDFCPSINDICMQGRGMLFNKSIINILLNNLNNFNDYEFGGCITINNDKIFGYDDNYISTCLNTYHINNNENYTNFIGSFLHMNVFTNQLINKYQQFPFILFDKIKQFITIALKDDRDKDNINVEKIKFLDKVFTENTINDYEELVKLSLKYDENPDVFVGFNNEKIFIKLNRDLHNKHTIALICTHYNHIDIAPFVLDYWKRFVTHAYVFDNGSNDGSLENFAKYDWITVQDMTQWTGGKLNDTVNITIKNNFWKKLQYEYDYVMICDFDEVLYCDDLERILYKCDKENIGMIYPKYCEMISEDWIPYQEGKLYHELNPYCHNKSNHTNIVNTKIMDKRMYLINPKIVKETNYVPGQHYNTAKAINDKTLKISNMYVFHLHYLGTDYSTMIHNKNKETLSEENKQKRYGIQYMTDADIKLNEERLANKVEYYNYDYEDYKTY